MTTAIKAMGMVQRNSTALGGQTQQETADKPARQDDVLFDEVCGLYKKNKNTTETMRSLKSKTVSKFYLFVVPSPIVLSLWHICTRGHC